MTNAKWLGWNYRKSHIIHGVSENLINYQINITVYYGSGVDNGYEVYLNGNCSKDFKDIRFTSNDGETELDYWIENKIDSNYCKFWVEIDNISKNIDNTIYIYYNATVGLTTSNGENTFVIFDDFSSDTSSQYTKSAWLGVNGIVPNMVYKSTGKYMELNMIGKGTGAGMVTLTGSSYSDEYSIDAKVQYTNDNPNEQVGIGVHGTTKDITTQGSNYVSLPTYNKYIRILSGSGGANNNEAFNWLYGLSSEWNTFYMSITSSQVFMYVNGDKELSANYVVQNGQVGFYVFGTITTGKVNVDELRIRKYVYPEPQHGIWGNIENLDDFINGDFEPQFTLVMSPTVGLIVLVVVIIVIFLYLVYVYYAGES